MPNKAKINTSSSRLSQKCTIRRFVPINMHISCLTNSVTSILSLSVHGRIPIAVIENHSIGTGKINAYATRSCRKYETEDSLVPVESLHQYLEEHNIVINQNFTNNATNEKRMKSYLTCLWSTFVVPSRRKYMWPWKLRKASKTSSILVIWVKIKTRWLPAFSFLSNWSKDCSFPQSYCISLASGNFVAIALAIGWNSASFGERAVCTSCCILCWAQSLCGGGCETWNLGNGAFTGGTNTTNLKRVSNIRSCFAFFKLLKVVV